MALAGVFLKPTVLPFGIDRLWPYFFSWQNKLLFLLLLISKQEKTFFFPSSRVPRIALPEDYNIYQNWKIAVEIYQFGGSLSNHSVRRTRTIRTIHNVISPFFFQIFWQQFFLFLLWFENKHNKQSQIYINKSSFCVLCLDCFRQAPRTSGCCRFLLCSCTMKLKSHLETSRLTLRVFFLLFREL